LLAFVMMRTGLPPNLLTEEHVMHLVGRKVQALMALMQQDGPLLQ
jgi:hypothetical protein